MTSVQDLASTHGSANAFIGPLTCASAGWIETSRDDTALATRAEPGRPQGLLARLGACLSRPFKALQEWIARLLAGPADHHEAAGNAGAPVRSVEPQIAPLKIGPPCFYDQPGPDDARYGAWLASAVDSLLAGGATASGRGAHGPGTAAQADAPSKKKRIRVKNFTRLIATAKARVIAPSITSDQPGLAGARGNGINELYFSLFKGPARGPVDPGLASAANLQALCDNLSAARTRGQCYRPLALDAAFRQLGSGQYFVERDNALVVFLGGVVDLADKLARKHGLANPEDLDVRQIDAGVGSILNSLTTGERNAVKLRLGDFLAESAEQVTTFAHEQASRVPGGHLGHPLALLGVGTRMVEALLRRLELEPLAPSSVAHVGELAVDELAALCRLLMPPDVHTPKV